MFYGEQRASSIHLPSVASVFFSALLSGVTFKLARIFFRKYVGSVHLKFGFEMKHMAEEIVRTQVVVRENNSCKGCPNLEEKNGTYHCKVFNVDVFNFIRPDICKKTLQHLTISENVKAFG